MMSTRSKLVILLAGVVVVALAVVQATRTGTPAGTADADGRLEIVLEDYRFDADVWSVPAARPVTFVFINRDDVSHPLTFGGTLIERDGRPAGLTDELFVGLSPRVTPVSALQPPVETDGFTIQIPGRTTVTLEVEFPDDRIGTWNVGCFLGRGCHLGAGLGATLEIVG
jgi:hypothetical protein